MLAALGFFYLITGTASAGPCDAIIKKADTSKGDDLVGAYGSLIKCDKKTAEDNFIRFMTSAGDADTLVSLSLSAIDAEIWTPVWGMVGKISSYDARDEVARRVGEACTDHGNVLGFLKGAYFGLRDIDFKQWDDALLSCQSPAMADWLAQAASTPPSQSYDEKYNTLITAYAKRMRADALPTLQAAAIKAAKAGPYDAILAQMSEAVSPDLGDDMSADDRAKFEKAMQAVAHAVSPDQARSVANQLASAGSEAAAAALLPSVFPDRVQSGGGFLYGGVSVETADCKGVKTAVIHYAGLSEPGKLWVILEAAQAPLRAFKPKLDKCKAESADPWPIAVSPEPLEDSKALDAWAASLQSNWADKGYEVSLKAEKGASL